MRSVLACLFHLLALSVFAAAEPALEDRPYSVYIPGEVPLEKLDLTYFMGGRGSITAQKNLDGTITLPRPGWGGPSTKLEQVDGWNVIHISTGTAKALRGFAYCPGFRTAVFREPALPTSNAKTVLTMEALPLLPLSGRIDSGHPPSEPDCFVEIILFTYLLDSDEASGPVPWIPVATVPLAPDGSFSTGIHDFLADPVFLADDPEPIMTVRVRSAKTDKILLWLATDPKGHFGNFPAQHAYPGVVTFYATPSKGYPASKGWRQNVVP